MLVGRNKKINKKINKGKVYLVGAGPGDPGLITLKGLRAIKEADCVIYDFLANARLIEYADAGVETIYVGKKGSCKSMEQTRINSLIVEKARSGKKVVRLKGGDPFVFGRGGEEAGALVKARIPFEVIPGVTSAVAAPAYAGIPLTDRELSSAVTFITGHEDPLKERANIAWDRLTTGRGTLVFLMGWKNLAFIRKKLLANGWAPATPVAIIRWGTMPTQVTVTGRLDNIVELSKEAGIKPPVITVVGEVVRFRDRLNWFETKPLFARRVVVTRAPEQAGEFTSLLESRGAVPVVMPVIKTTAPPDRAPLDRAIKKISTYDWAVFTSVNGVKYFFERLGKLGKDVRELKGVRICAIGPRTAAEIRAQNIKVDITPKKFIAEAVLKALGKRGIKGKRFLLARALVAREILPQEIKRLGGTIDVVPAYRTVRPVKEAGRVMGLLKKGEIDVITFTSSSTVMNFLSFFKKGEAREILRDVKTACIGPITARTARENGISVDIMPEEYTIPALTEAMEEYYARQIKG